MDSKLNTIKYGLDSLTVFSDLKKDPVISRFRNLLGFTGQGELSKMIEAYCDFCAELYRNGSDFGAYVAKAIIENDNFYVKVKAAGNDLPEVVKTAAGAELSLLREMAALSPGELRAVIDYDGYLPEWTSSDIDLKEVFDEKLAHITVSGYGIYASYNFFRLDAGRIVPIKYPDSQSLDQLYGYERERSRILKNTEAFVNGEPASNMLLYGDAGTGKSSTIKAVAAHLAPEGLRIIEVKKNQLYQIPDILEELSANPLKFILYVDDLSFSGNDDNFSALKAILEGSLSGCGQNVIIYATSNRRHLVKESFSDRNGDEIHVNDTLQETMSLAARFGLTITFQKPDKDDYLMIVRELAGEYGIVMDEAELYRKAEAHAIRKNGRSPRTAKQFVELLKIGL